MSSASENFATEALLAHGTWLRTLAAKLVEGAQADDLVQDTWVQALRHPPEVDRSPRGWLAQVMRNTLRMRVRSDRRRERRETFAAEGAEPATSPEALVERAQHLRTLSELVEELDEPYRGTVLLHYFEGMSAADIARAHETPAGTVRWRLKEGLDRLRVALDRRYGGNRGSWCLALAPISLGEHAATGTATAASGALTMQGAMKLAAATAILGGCVGAVYFGADRQDENAVERAAAVSAVEHGASEPVQDPSEPASTAEDSEAVASKARWNRKLARIRQVREQRQERSAARRRSSGGGAAERELIDDPDYAENVRSEIHTNLIPIVSECAELAPEKFLGTLAVEVTVIGEPDVGAVIEDAGIVPERSTIADENVVECIRQAAYTLDLDPPVKGGRGKVEFRLVVDTTDEDEG